MKIVNVFMFDGPKRAGTKFDLIGQLNLASSVIPGGQQVFSIGSTETIHLWLNLLAKGMFGVPRYPIIFCL